MAAQSQREIAHSVSKSDCKEQQAVSTLQTLGERPGTKEAVMVVPLI